MYLSQYFVEDEAKAGVAKIFDSNAKLAPTLPVERMNGLIHKGAKEVTLGDIARRSINQAPPATNPSTVIPVDERIVIATSKVNTDHRLETGDGIGRSVEIGRRVRNMARWWDNEIINGDATTDPKQLSGLRTRCAGAQLISMGTNGAILNTLTQFNAMIDAVQDMGGPRFVFTNKTLARALKNIIIQEASGATVADVTGESFNYEGWKIVALDRKHDNTPVLPFTEVQGTATNCTSMYAVATSPEDKVGVKLLMASNSVEVIPEGIRDLQYIDYVELAFGLAVYDDRALARLEGIKLA